MKCPYCKKYFSTKKPCIEHMQKYHQNELDADNMDAYQSLYFSTHGTIHGKCQCGCGRDTEWNYKTGKPYKVSTDPGCKKRIAATADARNVAVYGKPKLLDDMNRQKEMLKHRHISGVYKFHDGGEVDYVAKLEQNFLWFCDNMLEFTSNMILSADQHNIEIQYFDEQEQVTRTYIPDFYLPDYNALIEIKSSNSNPAYREETAYKEKYKDAAAKNQTQYNYIKIMDAKYGPFIEFLAKIVDDGKTTKRKVQKTVDYIITETACLADDVIMNETNFPGLHVAVMVDKIFHKAIGMCVSESGLFNKLYVAEPQGLTETTLRDSRFDNCDIDLYQYAGAKQRGNDIIKSVIGLYESATEVPGMPLLESVFEDHGVQYNFDNVLTTNNHRSDFIYIGRLHARGGER